MIPIIAPFSHVTSHVIETQLIGSQGCNRLCLIPRKFIIGNVATPSIPSYFVQNVTTGIFVAMTLVTATSGKFPFGFGGQSEIPACQLIQSCDNTWMSLAGSGDCGHAYQQTLCIGQSGLGSPSKAVNTSNSTHQMHNQKANIVKILYFCKNISKTTVNEERNYRHIKMSRMPIS